MTIYDWACIVLGSWSVLGCIAAVPIGRAIRVADQAAARARRAADRAARSAALAAYPPPVPAPSQHFTDETWLADQPTEVTLTETEVRLRFDDIVRGEFA